MEPEEYVKMDEVEARMWWYRALHARLLDALGEQHRVATGPVLDAGCGTGGLLAGLRRAHLAGSAFGLEWNAHAALIAAGSTCSRYSGCFTQ